MLRIAHSRRNTVYGRFAKASSNKISFIAQDADLEVDADSVSSDWTCLSEEDARQLELLPRAVEADDVAVFDDADSETVIRRLRLGDEVQPIGEAQDVDGYKMVPILKSGWVDSAGLAVRLRSQRLSAKVSSSKRFQVRKFRVRFRLPKRCSRGASGQAQRSKRKRSHDSSSASESASPINEAKTALEREAAGNGLDLSRRTKRKTRRLLCWLDAPKRYRRVALATQFLSAANILALTQAARHSSVSEIQDRNSTLGYKHHVVRFELQLRALAPNLYHRLLRLMLRADSESWMALGHYSRVYPAIEFIEYDVKKEGGAAHIEPHVDNDSVITLVAMLSAPEEYTGGKSCFRRGHGSVGHRELLLNIGDAVMFRGEKLLHWISPVTAGRRVVLQIELCKL